MRRNELLSVAVVTLGVCASHPAMGEFVPRDFEARRAEVAPVIDGKLDDQVWKSAQKIDEFFAYQSGGAPPAAETSARILWDDEFLYVGFEMADTDIRPSSVTANQSGRDAQLYLGDVIELFIKRSRDEPQYFEFEWSPNAPDIFDARFDRVRFGAPGTQWNTDVRWATLVDGTIDDFEDEDVGWTVEAAIPLTGFTPLEVGTEWTFTVARYDYFNAMSDKEQLMMSAIGDPELPNAGFRSGFHTYELYDNLHFVAVPEPNSVICLWILCGFAMKFRRRR